MDWFERLTGFREAGYDDTRTKLETRGSQLQSLVNGQSYGIGDLELASLHTLRERVNAFGRLPGRLKVSSVIGNVRHLHQLPENAHALFQVASQFNLLEMVSPTVTPEDGVARYENDPTQGPACAIAAGAATIYRNYFAPTDGRLGQTRECQLNGLADLGEHIGGALGQPVEMLWSMQNGYALCTREGLAAIAEYIESLTEDESDALGGKLRIGVHRDVEVTDVQGPHRSSVSQAFCSALPVAYSRVPAVHWASFASLILKAAYEATMWAAVANAQRGSSNVVFLTRLGGGAFGNDDAWIHAAMRQALEMVEMFELDVRLVSYGSPSPAILKMVQDFG